HRKPHPAIVHLDALFTGKCAFRRFFILPLCDFFEQRIDHLAFHDVTDDLATFEDDALALACRDAQVGLAGLAWAVHHTAENAELHRRAASGQTALHLSNDAFQINLQPAARWTRDQFRSAHAPLRRLQNVERGLYF